MNAYKKFGYYYDEVMSQLNYDLWVEFVEPYLKKDDSILDLACGTATFITMLKLKGYDVCGLDLSQTILEIASEKMKINHLDFPLYNMDMKDFKLNKKFDVITCFFDSINFLASLDDVKKMFNTVLNHLKPNGYFIFDILSKELMTEYEHNQIREDYITFKLDWQTKKASPTSLRHNIAIIEGDETFCESYYEYYYKISDLPLEHFKLIKISGDFNDDYQENDERILVVLQKL